MHQNPLQTLQALIQERYHEAKAIFWAGSVSQNQGTEASDLDLVVVYDQLPNAYREAFNYQGWPIDGFVHDLDTLRYFLHESKTGSGISGTIEMILSGRELTPPSDFSTNIIKLAEDVLKEGPAVWDKNRIDKERFLITDVLQDLMFPVSKAEQMASITWLYEALSQFYFRAKRQWCASGKSIPRYLSKDNPTLALEYTQSFETVFQNGETIALEMLIKRILEPYGGLLWDGFRSDAPKEFKLNSV